MSAHVLLNLINELWKRNKMGGLSSLFSIFMQRILSSWCLVMVEGLFLAVPRGCLRFVIVVFPDHTHLLFLIDSIIQEYQC